MKKNHVTRLSGHTFWAHRCNRMADTNTKEQDLIPQEKEKDTQNEVSEPTVEQKATEYMTLQKVESMVPYKFIPVLLPKYGWVQIKTTDYGQIYWNNNMALKRSYLSIDPKVKGKIECFVRQMQHSLVHSEDSVEVKEVLSEWEQNIFVDGVFAIARVLLCYRFFRCANLFGVHVCSRSIQEGFVPQKRQLEKVQCRNAEVQKQSEVGRACLWKP